MEREEWKFDTLCDLYDTLTITQAVIFCNTKRKVQNITKTLLQHIDQQKSAETTETMILCSVMKKDIFCSTKLGVFINVELCFYGKIVFQGVIMYF